MHTPYLRKRRGSYKRSFPLGAALAIGAGLWFCFPALSLNASASAVDGWLNWRGPQQNGFSTQTGLPERLDPKQGGNLLWTADFPGKGTPVLANGRLYVTGYLGEGPDLQEGLACYDAETGQLLWRQLFNDYLSDTIYLRYATSSPTVDAETGNIYIQGTQGMLAAFSPTGELLWKQDMMESFGRMTFPNARTGSPVIDRDLVITRGITANWGAHGPAGDRFYAFDKKSGELVWSSSPADRPKDNSFSHPILSWQEGRRMLYVATGDGSVVGINARTGDPLWRVPLFKAGINATVLVHNGDKIIAVFGTPYEGGHMVALKIPQVAPANAADGPVVLDRSKLELWTCNVSSSTSSPILVGDRVYLVAEKGDLCSIDANTGKLLWDIKLGIEQRNACPLYADGRLYVPLLEDPNAMSEEQNDKGTKGIIYVIDPSDTEGKIIGQTPLEGRCFGTPAPYKGKIYLQTASKLYCFGKKGENSGQAEKTVEEKWPTPGPATQLQIIPAEVVMKPGDKVRFRVRSLDARGMVVNEQLDPRQVHWDSYVPPTARVKSKMLAAYQDGALVADAQQVPSAGAFVAEHQGLKGYMRGRILPNPPFRENFESFQLSETTTNAFEPPTPFAYPPLPWIGARIKFEVREQEGQKALTKTIDNKLFQRAFVFIGQPELRNYTVQAEIMSEGNRRKMSDAGVINQRYLALLKGNEQKLEISSTQELFRYSAPFRWQPKIWYMIKSRVDIAEDGSGMVRAKAWKKGEPEPDAWLLEVPHLKANRNGSPGLFGFSPQEMRVYINEITVTANE